MCTQQQGGLTPQQGGSTPPVPPQKVQTADQQERPKQKIDHWTADPEQPTANID